MNNVNLIGRLTKDPEQRYTSGNNTAVASLTIAVDEGFGEKKKTHFINCTAWSKTAENISKYFKKGDVIGITGRITTRNWEDNEGKKHYVTEVTVEGFTFCGSKPAANASPAGNEQSSGWQPVEDDDELPF